MKSRRDILLPVLISIGLHGLGLSVAVHVGGGLPGPPRPASTPQGRDRNDVRRPRDPPIIAAPEEPPLERFTLGLETGTGDGAADADSPLAHRGLQGPNVQPGLSRDPVGAGGDRPALPAPPPSIAPAAEVATDAPARFGLPPPQMPRPRPVRSDAPPMVQDPRLDPPAPVAAARTESAPPPDAAPARSARVDVAMSPAAPTAAAPIPAAPTNNAPLPASPAPAPGIAPGDPLPQAELESDPFEPEGSAVIINGEVQARFGRAFKSVRPKLTFAAYQDMASVVHARIVMRITTDAAGYVTHVELLERTGKVAIDQPTEVAMYRWWFEPPKDDAGRPRPDDFQFTVTYR